MKSMITVLLLLLLPASQVVQRFEGIVTPTLTLADSTGHSGMWGWHLVGTPGCCLLNAGPYLAWQAMGSNATAGRLVTDGIIVAGNYDDFRSASFSVDENGVVLAAGHYLAWAGTTDLASGALRDTAVTRLAPNIVHVNGLSVGVDTATTPQPTCDVNARGTFWSVYGTTGVKDSVQVCAKDAGDAYAWRTIY
jgi:hypothetical protein